jgi:hypothetical protein
MKSKLLTSILGVTLLGASTLALADNGRNHNRGLTYYGPQDSHRYGHGRPHGDKRWHAHAPKHRHWRAPAWHAPYHRHYGYAPRHYGRHDSGVILIFKGRID